MPPSQLKRLKSSLREQGITGPQKSKKQKKSQSQNADQRVQRQAALQGIRDSFNPFEIKAPSRTEKFQATSIKNINGNAARGAVRRPGAVKSMGEEARRKSLLPEIQRRNKMGGLIDRRIGENDPTMDPEERALQRFAQERQRKSKGASVFDLEDDEEGGGLTHLGRNLDFDGEADPIDDFDANGLSGSEAGSDNEDRFLKRRRSSVEVDGEAGGVPLGGEDEGDEPARKKSKQEVMKEVMAKSKLYKYERQKAKEDDDDLREELDKGMSDMLSLLRGHKRPEPKPEAPTKNDLPAMNPERQAMLNGTSRDQANKQYDARLRAMAQDQRAAPAERTKTAEEKIAEEAQRLRKLEEARQKRMRGEESEEEERDNVEEDEVKNGVDVLPEEEVIGDDAAEFGLIGPRGREKIPALEEEDEFELDDDLIASGSDVDMSSASSDEESEVSDDEGPNDNAYEDEENEFVRGILFEDEDAKKKVPDTTVPSLAYTYPCPRSHEELLQLLEKVPAQDVPTIIQRIRALYDASLAAENKDKLADFAVALVDHISYMAIAKQPMPVIETLIRHVHSLSRPYAETIATGFRAHLVQFQQRGQPTVGDLMILTAISAVYSTSDHFHQVATPAVTLMARWLEMNTPNTPSSMTTGAFLVALCLRYQRLSQRYIPEAVRFTLKTLQVLPQPAFSQLQPHMDNLLSMADLWHTKSAFTEIFSPTSTIATLQSLHPVPKKAIQHLTILFAQSRQQRRPLELHHHKPKAIRTSYPKFEDEFDPSKHYDPDRVRAESAKLRKEYKREKKGAVRELRKDANFVAREQLRDKRERDVEYEKKYKRLVAEIQGTSAHEGNVYEREKRARKGRR